MSDPEQLFIEFARELSKFIPPEARLILCQFRGDPAIEANRNWAPKVFKPQIVDEGANIYFCVSAMKRNEAGEFRRRIDSNFAGGLCLMIDDIGTGEGSKFPVEVISKLKPTAMVETSPGNFQAMYFFDRFETDGKKFDRLVKGFIQKQFLGKDTGQDGINRVFRPPFGINWKPKYKSDDGKKWRVRLASWHPECRYSIEDIAAAFEIDLTPPAPRAPSIHATADRKELIHAYIRVRLALKAAKMLRSEVPDQGGWTQMKCPWTDQHSHGADNGAAIRQPSEENGWTGSFRCHHGTCAEIHRWRELTEWVADQDADILAAANANAGEWEQYQ